MPRSGGRGQGSAILRVLRRIDRKVRLNGFLEQLSVALMLVMGALLLTRVSNLLVPIATPPGPAIWAAGTIFFVGFFFWSRLHVMRLGQAAGVADSHGGLNDEIKTAHWFMTQNEGSPWVALQIDRAERTASRLDASLLVPVTLPRRLWVVLALGVVVQGLALLPVDGPLLSFAVASDSSSLGDSQQEQFEDIRDILEADDGELLTDEARERLEDALEELQAEDTSLEALLRDLREAQEALDEGNLELNALRDALDEMSEDLAESEQLAPLAEALQNRDLEEAADAMRELSELLSEMDPVEASEMLEQLQRAARNDQAAMEELLEALEQAAEALANNEMADAQQALQEAAEAVDQMADRQRAQEGRNEASQQMQELQQSMEQQQMAQTLMQMQAAAREGESESGEATMSVSSDEVNRSAGGESGDQSGPPGNSTSDPTGDGEPDLGELTTLEVQLALELLAEPRQEEEIDPEDIFQEASRQQTSTVQYRDVRGLSNYAEGSALEVEHVPWRFRSLVKKYFLAIRPQERR